MFRFRDSARSLAGKSRPSVRERLAAGLVGAVLVLAGSPSLAQSPGTPEAMLDAYLSQRGLREVQAAVLRSRITSLTGRAKTEAANRLGTIYTELLDAAQTVEQRERIERYANELLDLVPEAETFDLRINLAKAQYLYAQDIAERHRLRSATPEQRAEAERILRSVSSVFQGVATRSNTRVMELERLEQSGRGTDFELLRVALADARRVRSLAYYYAGWSSYYISLLTGIGSHASDATRHFGWLLNSPGQPARLERLPESLLMYEHVARASIGVALAESLRGADDVSLRWLDTLDRSPDLADGPRKQLVPVRFVILASARRWSDLEWHAGRRRRDLVAMGQQRLPVDEARLIAVLSIEALRRPDLPERTRPMIEALARTAMADLVNSGAVAHVLNLVQQFGTSHIGTEGFIVNYVRGLQAFEDARAEHRSTGADATEPATDPKVTTAFRAAAGLLEVAIATIDAGHFPSERANAAIVEGLALFYAGDFREAARKLGAAHAGAPSAAQAEEALWLAVVALDRAYDVEGDVISAEFDRLASLYLQSYPAGERAAKLLIRRLSAGLVSDSEAAEVLLGVAPESPLYEAARRHAARLLYRLYKQARGEDRQFAAIRFMTVAEQVLAMDRRAASHGSREQASQAGESAVAIVRQVLDASLGSPAPDLDRARASLEILDAIVAQTGLDLASIEGEIAFRRFQIAMLTQDATEEDRWLERLHAIGGPFADSADRVLYNRARQAYLASPSDAAAASRVVRHGARVMTRFAQGEDALRDPAILSLHATVAEAAAAVWKLSGDLAMRDVALRIDRELLAAGHANVQVLRRMADAAEDAGDKQEALDAWRTLLAGLPSESVEWFEARYHSLRLLWELDAQRARDVMQQHLVLHPTLGPEPWGSRLGELRVHMLASPGEAESRGQP